MLWISRKSTKPFSKLSDLAYKNPISYDVVLPEDVGRVVVGCFHPNALVAEVEIWRKLFGSYDPDLKYTTLLIGSWPLKELELSLPPTTFRQLEVRPDRGWSEIVRPDKPDRSFALVTKGMAAQILVVGTPTEETWEVFESYLENIIP